jgi:hypothetical protein
MTTWPLSQRIGRLTWKTSSSTNRNSDDEIEILDNYINILGQELEWDQSRGRIDTLTLVERKKLEA